MNSSLSIPAVELTWRFGPSGGPGGQHANTANTRAEVVFDIETSTVLTDRQRASLLAAFGPRLRVVADDTRSQARNRELATSRLAQRLATALQPRRVRRPTRPGRGATERRLQEKREHKERKARRRSGWND